MFEIETCSNLKMIRNKNVHSSKMFIFFNKKRHGNEKTEKRKHQNKTGIETEMIGKSKEKPLKPSRKFPEPKKKKTNCLPWVCAVLTSANER
jgi:hypothetical protein